MKRVFIGERSSLLLFAFVRAYSTHNKNSLYNYKSHLITTYPDPIADLGTSPSYFPTS